MASKRFQRTTLKTDPNEPVGILQFLVILLESDPLIWRRIQVPESYSFWDLHVAIQDSMGWSDSHLHEFEIWNPRKKGVEAIGLPDDEGIGQPNRAGWEVPVTSVLANTGIPAFVYTYDFGDNWRHAVIHEPFAFPEPKVKYPRCTGGTGKCPPEDVGGIPGFQNFLEAIRNRKHPEHEMYRDWIGGSYDPVDFDPRKVHFDDPKERLELALDSR